MRGRVLAVCRSVNSGTMKEEIPEGEFLEDYGIKGDAHAGDWHRQVSLLGIESIDKMRGQGLELGYGDFAENVTTKGLILYELPVGTRLKLGTSVVLEVTQIGKKCHHDCEIFQKIGECVMPREGIFARVVEGGRVKGGDPIEIISG